MLVIGLRVLFVVVIGLVLFGVIYNSIRNDERQAEIYRLQDRYDEYDKKQVKERKYFLQQLHKLGAEPDTKER